jgi:hypothetical protein
MLGGEITEPPDGRTDDAIVPRVSGRLFRQDKLEMLPRSSQFCAAGKRKRMPRSSHRDEFDSCKVNAPESFFVHVDAASDRDGCGTTAERALNFAKRLELQTKWSLVSSIAARSEIPFLHVFSSNHAAIALYRKLGFALRRRMHLAVLARAEAGVSSGHSRSIEK